GGVKLIGPAQVRGAGGGARNVNGGINVAYAHQRGALGTDVGNARKPVPLQLALNGEIPRLQVRIPRVLRIDERLIGDDESRILTGIEGGGSDSGEANRRQRISAGKSIPRVAERVHAVAECSNGG